VFAEHGVAGMVGLLFNGIFGTNYIIGLDGVNTGLFPGGWIEHNWKQMYMQIAYIVAASAYAFVVSAIIAFAINKVPGLHLRASEEAELLGMDDDQLGEFAYDYVEVRRDYLAWTPAKGEPASAEHNIPQVDRHGIHQHSQMLEGKAPSENSDSNGHAHTGIGGDRHAAAISEKVET
jgi:Amt family ammonium transporter